MLALGLAMLAAASWSLSQAFKVVAGLTSPSHPSDRPSSQDGGRSGGGAAGTNAHHGPAATPNPTPSPSASATTSGAPGPAPCPLSSIVLSLAVNRLHFAARQQPYFRLDVVSTQTADCSFNVGRGSLALVIKRGGTTVWSSADCITRPHSLVAMLKRGVPKVVAIGWNKKRAGPACGARKHAVRPGTYRAYAVDGSLRSAPITFRVR